MATAFANYSRPRYSVGVSDEYLTVKEAAARLGVDGSRIRQWCLAGAIPGARKHGWAWMIPASGLAAVAEEYPYGKPRGAKQSVRGRLSGEELAARRSALDLNQTEMSKSLGVSRQTLSSWERGASIPEWVEATLEALEQRVQAAVAKKKVHTKHEV